MFVSKPSWTDKGGSLSDKSACKEFGLTYDQIYEGIRKGKLQFRENHIHGNPYFRLLRHEVVSFAKELLGQELVENNKLQNELSLVKKEIRKLKKQLKIFEEKEADLLKVGIK